MFRLGAFSSFTFARLLAFAWEEPSSLTTQVGKDAAKEGVSGKKHLANRVRLCPLFDPWNSLNVKNSRLPQEKVIYQLPISMLNSGFACNGNGFELRHENYGVALRHENFH